MWSSPVTVTAPLSEPVSIEQAKEFLSIDAGEDYFDALLEAFVAVAREQVEAITGTRLVEQTVRLEASSFADLAKLPIGPVSEISGIMHDDADGVEQVFAATDWELLGSGLEQGIGLRVGKSWPSSFRSKPGAIRITAQVGYTEVPKPIWAAMLLMVGDLFANRETAVTGTVAAKVPMSTTVDALLSNYRLWA